MAFNLMTKTWLPGGKHFFVNRFFGRIMTPITHSINIDVGHKRYEYVFNGHFRLQILIIFKSVI